MRTRKQAHIESWEHHEQMAERAPDEKAAERFRRKPYQAAVLIREQGTQIEKKERMGQQTEGNITM